MMRYRISSFLRRFEHDLTFLRYFHFLNDHLLNNMASVHATVHDYANAPPHKWGLPQKLGGELIDSPHLSGGGHMKKFLAHKI